MASTFAEALWNARVNGTVVPVDEESMPETDGDAYALQAAVTAFSGANIIGWKLGATAPAALETLGVDAPFIGPLLQGFTRDNGAEVPIFPAHNPGIEAEFAVGLARGLPAAGGPYTRAQVAGAVGWIAPAFEIVGSRLESGLGGAGRLAIVDGGFNSDFVLGEPMTDWRRLDLTSHPVRLTINGEEAATGNSGMLSFGDPIAAVAWLAGHSAMAGPGLHAEDIITTGTCTGLIPIKPGDEAVADFGELGEVRARFTG